MNSNGAVNTNFLRHKANVYNDLGKFRIRYNDEHERNKISGNTTQTSYEFYDWQVSIGNADSSAVQYNVYFRQRLDWRADSVDQLRQSAQANHYGAEFKLLSNKTHKLLLNGAYRELKVLDTTLITTRPENTLLARIEHKMKLAKGAITSSSFYEIGSGLELKREFLYIEVQPGQGVYAWIDYNGDGIKDLNEFEIAAFSDQASYIRIFSPTNEYVKTFTNQFSQSFFLKPLRSWRSKKGLRKLLSKFSDQFLFRADRKTNNGDPSELYNPFIVEIADTALISVASTFRNTVYFNRSHQKYGADYSFQSSSGKTLLTSGFDSRFQESHQLRIRWNPGQKFTIQTESELGDKHNQADYVNGRNYKIEYMRQSLKLSYQPNLRFRVALQGKYQQKQNDELLGGEYAQIIDNGVEFRYNVLDKGSLIGQANFIINTFTGNDNTTLAYEMLDALRTGQNYTWSLIYQRSINKNLQLNLNYVGRKSPENRTIHTGGVQLRALF